MQPLGHHNVAVAEVMRDGQIGHVKAAAATAKDDAIQLIAPAMANEGIDGDSVLRVYSERMPGPDQMSFITANWPNAKVTWSFEPGQEDEMESAIASLSKRKPWWKFW
jgi:hypothetical protein